MPFDEATLKIVQRELKPWQAHNFPGRPAWQPLLGIAEEVGELSHSFLKREQRIRTEEDHDAGIKDAVADIVIYLCDFCNAEGIDLDTVLAETWAKVRKRDWRGDPAGAKPNTECPSCGSEIFAHAEKVENLCFDCQRDEARYGKGEQE